MTDSRLTQSVQSIEGEFLDASTPIISNTRGGIVTLKARFLGAVGTVTGSCTLVHHELTDSFYLIDCGMYQGDAGSDERNRRPFDFNPKRIAAVLLTHAHLDHCGLLPRLVAEGFSGKVFCTRPTAEFTKIALRDRGAGSGELWPEESVQRLDSMFKCPDEWPGFRFGHFYPLGQELFFSFLRSSHIVGSVSVELRINTSSKEYTTVTFSGDLGTTTNAGFTGGLQKKHQYPNPRTSVVVCESTNGGRVRPPELGSFGSRISALADALAGVVEGGEHATVLLPAFSLQRTQDLLIDIDHVLRTEERAASGRNIDLFITSGLARSFSEVLYRAFRHRNHKGERMWLNTDSPLFAGLNDETIDSRLRQLLKPCWDEEVIDYGDRRLRIRKGCPRQGHTGPTIILSTPGMCTGGTSLDLLGRYAVDPDALIAFTGYIPAYSPASTLLKYAEPGAGTSVQSDTITLWCTTLDRRDIRASVVNLGAFYSGHADATGLTDFILARDVRTKTQSTNAPISVILNHGDRRARAALRQRIKEKASNGGEEIRRVKTVHAPERSNEWFDLVAGEWGVNSTDEKLRRAVAANPALEALLREAGVIDPGR